MSDILPRPPPIPGRPASRPTATEVAFGRLAWILLMLHVASERWVRNPSDPRIDGAAEIAAAAIRRVQDIVYHASAGNPATAVRLAEEAAEPVEALRAAIYDDWLAQRPDLCGVVRPRSASS